MTWAKEYNSCYGHITDNPNTFDEIQRYKFCPEGSPYMSKMVEAFAKESMEKRVLQPGYIS